MTRDEIIRMAREAGMERTGLFWHCDESELVRVVVNVINREREACARLCEREHDPAYAARAIRARSKP